MVRVGGFLKSQNRIRRQRARGRFISPYQVGGTIFGKSTMARYPLMNTTHRINPEPWRVRRMKGGTIFGKFTRRRNNPLGFPTATDRINPEPWRVKQALRRMKGGTIFGKFTRRRNNPLGFPTATDRINPAPWRVKQALRRMKGGDLRKVLWANQAKARKQRRRQGIKRGRR